MEGLFLPVTTLWQVLGAIDEDDRLTALGWWGLPEAMRRVWAAADGLGQRLGQLGKGSASVVGG